MGASIAYQGKILNKAVDIPLSKTQLLLKGYMQLYSQKRNTYVLI